MKPTAGKGKRLGLDSTNITYISTHDWGTLEDDRFSSILALLDLFLRHIAQRGLVLGDLEAHIERSFEIWFIETGECSSSIAGFELSAKHDWPRVLESASLLSVTD